MFAGEFLCKVDEKVRFLIPSPLRERFESEGQSGDVPQKYRADALGVLSQGMGKGAGAGLEPRWTRTRVACSCTM